MTESAHVWTRSHLARLWRNVGGWILVALGVAGLMLPVLPGIPLLIAGLVMLLRTTVGRETSCAG